MTVGLLHALYAYQGHQLSTHELAERACAIEIDRCGKPIGKQDQYIAAFGGIRDLRFGPGDRVIADELGLAAAERRALQQQMMLFYTGVTRNANTILREQRDNIESSLTELDQLRDLAGVAVEGLRDGDIDAVGAALRVSWDVKRKLATAVSNDQIDGAIDRALRPGPQVPK